MRNQKNTFDLSQTLVTAIIVVVLVGISLITIWIVRGISAIKDPDISRPSHSSSQSSKDTKNSDSSESEGSESSYAEGEGDLSESSAIDQTAIDTSKYKIVDFSAEDMTRGDLILINADHEYVFRDGEEETFVPIYGNKNKAYRVKDAITVLNQTTLDALNDFMLGFNEASGLSTIQVISGYRSYETQKNLYDNRVKQQGEEEAAKLTAKPGHSEHHSGYAVDLNIYSKDGIFSLTNTGNYTWIYEHAHEYGFIQRYVDEKASITGISDEPWHFRYVGMPHASIMSQRGWCFEEYMQYLEGYPFGVSHLKTTGPDGSEYEIYYVAASADGSATSVPVPVSGEYTVSGNNAGGFIVTIKLS